MTKNLTQILESFAELEVLVLGEAMLDTYLDGSAGRLCREAPVPVVDVTRRTDTPGGAANAAANVAALAGRARLVSVVGDDEAGAHVRRELQSCGVDCSAVTTSVSRRTIRKSRVSAASQILVRFDEGTIGHVDRRTEAAMLDALRDIYASADAVIVSDYGYGVVTSSVVATLTELQAVSPRVLVVDSRHLSAYTRVGATAVKPNYEEAVALLGAPSPAEDADRGEWIWAHARPILEATGAEIAAVTLDTEGAVVLEHGRAPYRTYADPVAESRATGAGDTFGAALALALAAGAHTPAAAELAQIAASVAVAKDGTATCSAAELREQIYGRGKRLADLEGLSAVAELYHSQGRRIVFTNGCFDILHRGHITYLNQAKSLGDLLIVGLNSDDSVARLKGPDRPINSLEDRIELLSALSCVDYIVPFEEDRPTALIQAIRPDVYVKGGDYTRATLPETEVVESVGGEVRLLPYVRDRSTTGVIERIKALR
jgi:D-beta-D-heptose 7-phosphate kinase / D-beta-D-heptose 1-phosphate adenosyltransferase